VDGARGLRNPHHHQPRGHRRRGPRSRYPAQERQVRDQEAGNPVINPSRFRSAARRAIRAIGYEQDGFHWKTCKIDVLLHSQSADIAQGVDNAADRQGEEGAGDQGIMFGYACRETPDLMPAPIYYSHKILELMAEARHKGEGDAGKLGPDAKSQVTIRYETASQPRSPPSWCRPSTSMPRGIPKRCVRSSNPMCARHWAICPSPAIATGTSTRPASSSSAGPDGDAGLTGRKIIVDTYGGAAPHGGGAFSGKDTTKVDRSAAYAARYLAKNIVAAKLADRCTIQLSYAIGVAQPLSVYVDTHGTGKVHETVLEKAIRKVMDLSPSGIRRHPRPEQADLCQDAAYGHFGRKPGAGGAFSWEKTNLTSALKAAVKELA
jgi:S-adenosylmethionine synthetase